MGPAYIRVRSSLEHASWCMAFYQEHESRTCIGGQHSCEPARNSREEFFKIWSNLDAITFKNHFLCLQINSSLDGLVITGVQVIASNLFSVFIFLEKDRSFSSLSYLVIWMSLISFWPLHFVNA